MVKLTKEQEEKFQEYLADYHKARLEEIQEKGLPATASALNLEDQLRERFLIEEEEGKKKVNRSK